jgi:Spy/CpxP family protein refolding chaperone
MKKLLIVSLLTLGLVAGAQAQDTDARQGKYDASRMTEHMAGKIGVTESQLPAFQAVLQAQQEKRRALHKEFRAQQEALEAETQQELAGVLTAEQLNELQAMKDKRRDKWQGKGQDRKHGKGKGKDCAPEAAAE